MITKTIIINNPMTTKIKTAAQPPEGYDPITVSYFTPHLFEVREHVASLIAARQFAPEDICIVMPSPDERLIAVRRSARIGPRQSQRDNYKHPRPVVPVVSPRGPRKEIPFAYQE